MATDGSGVPDPTLPALAEPAAGHPSLIWRNGELVSWEQATVHVNAVGHASVAAVFEGIKAYRAGENRLLVFRLAEHLARLVSSARICRLTLPYGPDDIASAVLALLRANAYDGDTYIRPWAFPQGIIREQMVPAGVICEMVIDTWPFSSQLRVERGCRAMVSSWIRTGEASMPPRVKAFSNYHNGRLAVIEARTNGHDWPVLLNGQGKVSEGPGACIALVRDSNVITPSLTSDVLESITRATALELLREAGIPTEERQVDRSELYLADELFYLGTGWEILPITEIDGLPVGDGKMGPIAARLEHDYADVVRGGSGRHAEWLTEVAW
jgi:branched-chain amino acid aminotransferase